MEDEPGRARREHDRYATEYDRDLPNLRQSARELMKGEPIRIRQEQAQALRNQFEETVRHRGWFLLAGAVMVNHVHLVVMLPQDLRGMDALQDLKAYGSRKLNRDFGRPASGTWWTVSCSGRLLPHRDAIEDAVQYVLFGSPTRC